MTKKPTAVPCPTCGTPVPWTKEQRWRPFCSERCKLIDLGEWFEERRSIPDEDTPAPQDYFEGDEG